MDKDRISDYTCHGQVSPQVARRPTPHTGYNRRVELIDTHCHIDDASFDPDRDAVLARCRAHRINRLIVPAVTAAGWDKLIRLCADDSNLFPALGLHPLMVDEHHPDDLHRLEQRLSQVKPVAVGEIGLDHYIKTQDTKRQYDYFVSQLELAQHAGLPVILHVRKAHDQVLNTLKRFRLSGGIAHAFNGSLQQAKHYLDLGFKLGFGGMLTFERSTQLRQLARVLPANAIVLETDAPDMTVAAHRGQRNSPEYLTHCLTALAQVRNEPEDIVARQTTQNALEIFTSIPQPK